MKVLLIIVNILGSMNSFAISIQKSENSKYSIEGPSSFDSKIKSIAATEESFTATFESFDETGVPRSIRIVANNFKDYNRANLLSVPVLIAAYQTDSILHIEYKADINMDRIMGYYPVILLKK